jgi:hypothetical protein
MLGCPVSSVVMKIAITELLEHISRYSDEIRVEENVETLRDAAFDLSTAASELFLETLS